MIIGRLVKGMMEERLSENPGQQMEGERKTFEIKKN